MNQFSNFVKKETLQILRDKRTLLVVVVLPTVLLLLFGFAISMEINNINFVVMAPNRTATITRVVNEIAFTPNFTFKGYVEPSQVTETLKCGEATMAICFDNSYDRITESHTVIGDTPLQLVVDASNPNNSSQAIGMVGGIISRELGGYAPNIHILYNPQMKSSFNFVPGIMGLVFILVCALMTSVSIVREKENGTMEVLLVSPAKPQWIVFSKMLPYFVLCCLNLVVILLLSRYILDVPLSGSLSAMVLISLLYLLLSLSLGLLISTLVATQTAALLISGMALIIANYDVFRDVVPD